MDAMEPAHRIRSPYLVRKMLLAMFGWMSVSPAAVYYVAVDGNNSNAGTIDRPFASLQKGHDVAVAGDTVYIRGGRYSITNPASSGAGIVLSKSGTESKRICYFAFPNEKPVFDFAKMTISTTGYTMGIVVSGSWLHLKGFEVANVPMNTRSNCGMSVNGASNDIFERMEFDHNNGTGLFFNKGAGGHLVLNSDSHDNYDPTSSQGDGQNSDGFGVHYQTTGTPTVFRGCRAWWNSDDGWDFISQEVPVVVENCWAYMHGYANSGTKRPGSGNGNGFKAGSSQTGIRHTIRNSVAWKNAAAGFYANHSSGGNDWFNNTSYNNGVQFNLLASTWDASGNRTDGVVLTGSKAHVMRNNIGFPNKNSNMTGVDSKFNSWDLGITPSSADFLSVSDSGFTASRQPDGSLPDIPFLKLRAGSPWIDKGLDVGLRYQGVAPDLGAYERASISSAKAQTRGASQIAKGRGRDAAGRLIPRDRSVGWALWGNPGNLPVETSP